MRFLILFFILFPVIASTAPVDKKVDDIEKKLTQLEQTYLKNNAQVASGLLKVDSFESRMTEVQGEQQASQHLLQRTQNEIGDRLSEIEHRISVIEDRFEIFMNQMSRALKKVNPAISQEGELYQDGLDKVSKAEYMDAVATFQTFLKKHPDSPFVPSAQYWIGECYYSLRDWQKAIKQLQDFVTKYPKDEKASAAVLKQGLSFLKLNMPEEAKVFFNHLISKYPEAVEVKEAKEKLELIASGRAVKDSKAEVTQTSYPEKTIQEQKAREK